MSLNIYIKKQEKTLKLAFNLLKLIVFVFQCMSPP